MILYSNSCSFGAPGQCHDVYSDYVAKEYSATLINKGVSGSCNRRIIRSSLRDLIELKNKSDIVALIGLTFISRTELWQPWQEAIDNDGHFFPLQINHEKIDWSISGLIDTIVPNVHEYANHNIRDYYKNWLLHYHPESVMTDLLADIIMFCGWADYNRVKYIIFSNVDVLPKDDKVGYTSPFIQSLQQQILNNKNIINPWEFSFGTFALAQGLQPKDYHLYKNHGHPGEQAHKLFSEILINHLQKNT
jgi:hypothetical protein